MIALTVRQPWAWALVTGRKDVENRSWYTEHRGLLWIHASTKPADPNAIAWIRARFPHISVPNHYATGALVGNVTLTDCAVRSESVWYVQPNYAWLVTDGFALRAPVPMRGKQGLWAIDAESL